MMGDDWDDDWYWDMMVADAEDEGFILTKNSIIQMEK
jgi:hypothetical protein